MKTTLGMKPPPLPIGGNMIPSPKNAPPELATLKMDNYEPQSLDPNSYGKKALTPT
jgi:hypothetical protein